MKFTSYSKLWKILRKMYVNNKSKMCMICQILSNVHDQLNFKKMILNEMIKDEEGNEHIRLEALANKTHSKLFEQFIHWKNKTSKVIPKKSEPSDNNAFLKSKKTEKLKASVFLTFIMRKLLNHIVNHDVKEEMILFDVLCHEVLFLLLNNKYGHSGLSSRFLLKENYMDRKKCSFISDWLRRKQKIVSFYERNIFVNIFPSLIISDNVESNSNNSKSISMRKNNLSFSNTRAICTENRVNDKLSKLANHKKFRKNMSIKSIPDLTPQFKENVIKYCTCLICKKSDKNKVYRLYKALQQRETFKTEKTIKLSKRSTNPYPSKSSLILDDISNKGRFLETMHGKQGDSKTANSLSIPPAGYQNNLSITSIIEDIPGIAKRDYLDWFEPKKTTLTINVLEMIPQKTNKSSNSSTNNSVVESSSNLAQLGKTKTIQRISTSLSNIDRTPTSSSTYSIDVTNISNSNDLSYGYAEYLSKNNKVLSNYFNLNVNISTEENGKRNETSDAIKLFSDDNLSFETKKQLVLTKEKEREECKIQSFRKKEEDSKKNGEFNVSRSKTIMNLTNFYNDAKNQIDDSECDSPSEIYENSQYESVTVLKTEPIIYNSTANTLSENELNTKQLNNLDDAIFVFQNNLEPIENVSNVFTSSNTIANKNVPIPILENTTKLLIGSNTTTTATTTTTSTTTSINFTNENNINNVITLTEKSRTNIKLTNLRNTSLSPSFQNLSDVRLSCDSKSIDSMNNTVKNDNSNVLCNANSFVPSNENKIPYNKINIKYVTLADENTSEISTHCNLPSASTIPHSKCNLVKNKPSVKTNCNVKYLVKDKNVFKLFYVKAPPTDVIASNANISYLQHTKELIKDKKVNHIGSQSDPQKTDSFFETPSVNLPKLIQFEPVQNKNIKVTDVSKMRPKKSESNDKQDDSPSKSVNIIYRTSKNPLIVGSKNVIVSFPPANKQFSTPEVQNNLFSLSVDKEKDQKSYPSVSKKALSTTACESSSSQTPPISSTAMEQVREFESILEKVTKISQLKDKVPHGEGIDDPLSNNQVVTKNVSAVALGNILLQPAKIATYTNFIYTSDAKMTTTEKNSGLKQPISNKATKQINTSFQPAPVISNSISTTANSAIKPLQKAQEDEKTTEKIYKILHSYSEKIKNAPELKNKPAPRRRSNPPLNTSAKCKKSVKCSGKLMYEANSSTADYNCDFESNDKEITTSVFPIVTNQTKDNTSSNPLQIHHLAMPLSAAQDNQVVFVTNDKHLIFKKIKNVQKLWTKNHPTVKPIIKVEPGIKRTQVVHYNIKNSSVNGLNFINYSPPTNKPANVINTTTTASSTTTTTTTHLTSFSPHSTINSVTNQNQVSKLAQETQTDVTMQNSNVAKKPFLDFSIKTKNIKSCVNKINLQRISVQSYIKIDNISHLCVNLDKHYLKNIDVLFFTSLIVLKHPSSQLFMFEAINALNRIMETNPSLVSNSPSKHFSVEQIHNLDSTFWKKFRIIYDIILKKKGPHITDTMILVVEKVDKIMSDKLTMNDISEDKIKVNKCNKNPKCYGKKNGDHSGVNKTCKFPHPLEPTVIITNKLLAEDVETDESESYKKMSKCGRKRNFCKIDAINFDEIEVENPKICISKKKKKFNKMVPSVKVAENMKNNNEILKCSMKTRQNNKINMSKKRNFKKNKLAEKVKADSRKKLLEEIGNNNKISSNDLLHVNGKKQDELCLEKEIKKSQIQNFKITTSIKDKGSGSKKPIKNLKTNDIAVSSKRSIRSVVLNQANKKQKII